MGIINVTDVSKSTKGYDPAHRECVSNEAIDGHAGLNLLQLEHGRA